MAVTSAIVAPDRIARGASNAIALTIAFLALAAPTLLFAGSMRTIPGLVLATGALGCLGIVLHGLLARAGAFLRAPLSFGRFAACIAIAAAILLLGGETHTFRPTTDWYFRDAVLSDMVRADFPVMYRINGTEMMLRAPLGMYVVPALVGHAFGLAAAHAALLAQNAIALGALFYALLALGRGWSNFAILVGFSGAGALVRLIGFAASGEIIHLFPGSDPIDAWNPLMEYTGSITQFFWVPNHAIPGWALAVLLLLRARKEVDTATIGASVALLMFWSPLAVLPAIPCLIYFAIVDARGTFLNARTWIAGVFALLCLPVAAFMTAASSSIPQPNVLGDPEFPSAYLSFIPVQLAPAIVLYFLRDRVPAEWRGLLLLNVALLVVLPFFSFGEFNDLVMRGSIASLTILGFLFGWTLCGWGGVRSRAEIAGLALVVIGASAGLYEIWRGVAWATYPVSACNVVDIVKESKLATLQTNYIAPIDPMLERLFDTKAKPIVETNWVKPSKEERAQWPGSLTRKSDCWGAP